MSALAFQAPAAPTPRKVNIVQGEHFVTDDQGVTLTTVLGSCVAACLFDPKRGVGGMNHFLLADSGAGGEAAMRYGAYAMEVLINDLMKHGAARERLQAKVFGGAKMMTGLSDIGGGNAALFTTRSQRKELECPRNAANYPSISSPNSASLRTATPSLRAFSSLLPAFSPAIR